jgi:hypothetical protein
MNLTQNQKVDLATIPVSSLTSDTTLTKSVSSFNNFNLNSKLEFSMLVQILNFSHQDFKELGLLNLPLKDKTYLEGIQLILDHYKKTTIAFKEAKILDKSLTNIEDLDIQGLVKTKILQEIRHKKAQEKKIYSEIALSEGKFIPISDITKLITPLIMTIRSTLVSIKQENSTNPSIKKQINDCLNGLKEVGVKLLQKAKVEDLNSLEKEVDSKIFAEDLLEGIKIVEDNS